MFFTFFLTIIILLLPTLTLAQYVPLVGIPGVTDPNNDFSGYINALYAISIAVAGLLAVVKLVIAGVKYMMTDIVTTKGDAKKDIQGALLGLLVVLAAVLILTIINQDITEADIQVTPAREVPAPPPPYVPTIADVCSTTTCTTANSTEYVNVTEAVLLYSDVAGQQIFIDACTGSARAERSGENVTMRCFELTDAETTRITEIAERLGVQSVLLPYILRLYSSRVAPYLVEELTENQIFEVDGDYETSSVRSLCEQLGGVETSGWTGSIFTCEIPEN